MSRPAKETLGQRLRRLRKERGVSQRSLAEPGISYAYLSRIEADERTPSMKALRLLALKLGVSAEYLENGHEPGVEQFMDKLHDLFPEEPVLLLARVNNSNRSRSNLKALYARFGKSNILHVSDHTRKKR